MDWFAFATNLINRIPIERVLFPPRDNAKALEEFAKTLPAAESQKTGASEPKMMVTIPTPEKPEIEPQEASKVYLTEPQPGGPSLKETVDYQNRELGKLLYQMEKHYAQRLRIAGIPCDCGSSKHLLGMEALSEETIPMVDNPQVYYRIMDWIKEAGPKSTDEAAKSGLYDEEYPVFSHQARDFRKEIIGSLEPSALFPQKPGELEGTRILPVVTEEEKEQIREKAHKKIEEVLQ